MDSPTGTKPSSRGLQEEKNKQSYSERYKKPVPCMKNERVVNMSGVKKDQGGVEEETSTSKRTGASHFRVGLATDLKCCFVRSSWSQSPKNIQVWEAFSFLGRLTITLTFSMEFNKKKSKTKEACGRELILCQALCRPSVCAFRTGVLHAIESLFSKFSDWPNLPGRAKCDRWWRRERMGICTWISQHSKCEESNECASKEQWISAESLLSWASPFEHAASGGFCATIYFLVGVSVSYRRWFFNCGTCYGSEKKANRKWKDTGFQCQRMAKMFPPVRLPPRAFRAVFECAYAALHRVLSYAMTYSHKPHSLGKTI